MSRIRLLIGVMYLGYGLVLLGLHASVALDNPTVAPLTGSIAGIAIVVPLVPLRRYGFFSR